MAQPMVPAHDAFLRTLEDIRTNTNNQRIMDATYQLEVLSAAFWPHDSGGPSRDRWRSYGLTPLESRLADLLMSKLDKTVTQAMFQDFCYFDRRNEPEPKILDVKICHLRKKLKASPYRIETVWGSGYRMELKPI